MSYDEFPLGPGLSINALKDPADTPECKHGRLPFDGEVACGCFNVDWKARGVTALPVKPKRKRKAA